MNCLPPSKKLPVNSLASSFDNVTNSYKFYWFLAILEHVRENQSRIIPVNDLLARMVSAVWYPINYYRISFGKQDRLSLIANQVGIHTGVPINSNRQEVIRAVQHCLTLERKIAQEILNGILVK